MPLSSPTPKRFKIALLLMWLLLLYTLLGTFFCYWLINDGWTLFGAEPRGSIQAGFYQALNFLSTWGLIPIIWTTLLITDQKLVSCFRDRRRETASQNLDPIMQRPLYKDTFRIMLSGILFFMSLPWLSAVIGIFIGDIPIFNFFMSTQPIYWESNYPAVHLGLHHGYNGFYICALVVLASYTINWIRTKRLKTFMGVVCSIGVYYGAYTLAEDFLNEQFYKYFRLSGIELPFLRALPYGFSEPIFYGVLSVMVVLGILTYLFIWKKRVELPR
jgi:hypothetical protein